MDSYFNSKKYIMLLILVCAVFFILIIKAFQYLPSPSEYATNNEQTQAINSLAGEQNIQNENQEEKMQEESENEEENTADTKSGVLYKAPMEEHVANEQFEEIKAPTGSVNETQINTATQENKSDYSNEELALKAIIQARNFTKNDALSDAINEYKKVAELTEDKELLAESYDGLADVYAKNKKFGTALTYASKAERTSPSLSRQVLIAKIYYLSGQTDVAKSRLEQIIKQGYIR